MFLGITVFLIIMVAIGVYTSKKIKGDSTNYIVAGRGLLLPLAAATLMAQSVDANATLGNTDLASEFGFWAGASLPLGLALCLFLTGAFFAKPMNRLKLITLGDFYRLKYGRTVEVIASLLMVLSFSFLLAGNLVAGGYLFQTFMGTSYAVGVFSIAAVVLVYTVAGGLFAVAYTDAIQVVIALIGSLILIGYIGANNVVPPLLSFVIIAAILSASLSTGDGAILGTSSVIAQNIFGVRHSHNSVGADRLLWITRLMALLIALMGIFFALRVPATGMLLLLAFDLGFAGLVVPLAGGLWWSGATREGALACIILGSLTRLVLFVLMPVTFGIDNTLLHIPNEIFTPAFDGIPTLISPIVGFVAFVLVSKSTKRNELIAETSTQRVNVR